MVRVEIISRFGCRLCEIAESVVKEVKKEIDFELVISYVDESESLNEKYSEEVPVTLINGERHDYFKVNKQRFKNSILAAINEPKS
ncbi:MAG: glutaredoxin family protein [Gammaproteobacteria bacterium]|nr:glutaredoxin family protein [Gammaproteobacteria bacterium]